MALPWTDAQRAKFKATIAAKQEAKRARNRDYRREYEMRKAKSSPPPLSSDLPLSVAVQGMIDSINRLTLRDLIEIRRKPQVRRQLTELRDLLDSLAKTKLLGGKF